MVEEPKYANYSEARTAYTKDCQRWTERASLFRGERPGWLSYFLRINLSNNTDKQYSSDKK